MKRHDHVQWKEKMKCDKCNMKFKDKKRMKRHQEKAHKNKPKYHKGNYWIDDVGGGVI